MDINGIVILATNIVVFLSAFVSFVMARKKDALKAKEETEKIKDGVRCLLRANILRTYYKRYKCKTIKRYELENFLAEYQAYEALHGNMFVHKIYDEVINWEVIPEDENQNNKEDSK